MQMQMPFPVCQMTYRVAIATVPGPRWRHSRAGVANIAVEHTSNVRVLHALDAKRSLCKARS